MQAYQLTDKSSEIAAWLEALPAKGALYLDTETTSLDWRRGKLLLLQLWVEGVPPLIVDCRNIPLKRLGKLLKPALEGSQYLKVGHNLAFDYKWIKYHLGVTLTRIYDTMVGEKLLTAGTMLDCGLGPVAERYLGITLDKSIRQGFVGWQGDGPFPEAMLQYAADDITNLPGIMRQQFTRLTEEGLMPICQDELEVLPVLAEAELKGVLIDWALWEEHVAAIAKERDALAATLEAELQPYVEQWRERTTGQKQVALDEKVAEYNASLSLWQTQLDCFMAENRSALVCCGAYRNVREVEAELKRRVKRWKERNPKPTPPAKVKQAQGPIKLGSSEQVAGTLELMGVDSFRTPQGVLKTDKLSLLIGSHQYPILGDILKWRSYAKLVNSYGEPIIALRDEAGRLHPQFNQNGAATGRMSCSKPNAQNIPAGELGAGFRRAFIAPPGYKLGSADYSQIELAILAELSQEPVMLAAFALNIDLHSLTAFNMFAACREQIGVEQERVTQLLERATQAQDTEALEELKAILKRVKEECDKWRRAAKSINFGLAYGISKWGLSRQLQISPDEAQEYIDSYHATYPKVTHWLKITAEQGLMCGYAATIKGRKRYFRRLPAKPSSWDFSNKKEYRQALRDWESLKSAQERAMQNHPIQGSSADITKRAVARFAQRIKAEGLEGQVYLLLCIHDELVVEMPEEMAEYVGALLVEEMLAAAQETLKTVKVRAEVAIADFWCH